jgi:hypothetical protein
VVGRRSRTRPPRRTGVRKMPPFVAYFGPAVNGREYPPAGPCHAGSQNIVLGSTHCPGARTPRPDDGPAWREKQRPRRSGVGSRRPVRPFLPAELQSSRSPQRPIGNVDLGEPGVSPVPPEVAALVERFARNRDAYRSPAYNEAQTRREFIDPLFKALGWDLDNVAGLAEAYKDVIHEDAIKVGGASKAPDYCFRIGGTRKFFVEAKKPAVGLETDPEPAYQLRRYAWTSKLPLSILTDFEEFAVYDCGIRRLAPPSWRRTPRFGGRWAARGREHE